MSTHPIPPRTLTIAGSDSGGGAGIQADLKTFTALGTYGLSVITALTSQNTLGVDAIEPVSPAFVARQLKSVIGDIGVDTIKIGMLHNSGVIHAVVDTLQELYRSTTLPPIVLDPVMVSTSEHVLLDPPSLPALRERLLPLCALLTPNLPEAIQLASMSSIENVEDMKEAARKLGALGCEAVLVKGGHLKPDKDDKVRDVLLESSTGDITVFEHPRVHTKNTHGTGCTLSAALAAFLAQGQTMKEAVQSATDFVQAALVGSFDLGRGSGPLNHLASIIPRALPAPSELNAYPFTTHLIRACGPDWTRYTREHPFVLGLKDGTLRRESFVHFLKQDYIFLKHYARIHALAAYKSQTYEEIEAATDIVKHIVRESSHHVEFCAGWGITLEEFHATPESSHTVAYTRYVLDTGVANSLLALRVATAPCLLGYGDIGTWLYNDPGTKREGNPYWIWIEGYAGEDFQQAVETGRDLLEHTVKTHPLSPIMLAEMVDIFRKATRLEVGFWDQSWNRT